MSDLFEQRRSIEAISISHAYTERCTGLQVDAGGRRKREANAREDAKERQSVVGAEASELQMRTRQMVTRKFWFTTHNLAGNLPDARF